jgi:Protein of unknown function (DUF1573)
VLPRVRSLKLNLRSQRLCLRLGMLMWVCTLSGVLALGPSANVEAQVATLTWADKMLSERRCDFGSPPAGTGATHGITISNIYKETVTISEVISSSSEIKARVDKTTVASKEKVTLELALDATASGKPIDAFVTLKMTFDGANYKTVVMPVTAYINPDTVVANPVGVGPDNNWAEQMFAEVKHDFGSVAKGAEVKHVITITNPWNETVTFSGLSSSCSCISPQMNTFELKSKQTAQLTLNLDTLHFSKKRQATVHVSATIDGQSYQQVRIPIEAYIRGDVVIEPGSVQFGLLAPGEAAERRVRIRYAGRSDWTIRSVRNGHPHLATSFTEVSRIGINVEYELLVKLAGTAPLGPLHGQVVLETDDQKNPTIPVLVDGSIEPDLQVTPGVVPFGALKPGVPKVVKVVVKGRKPFRIEKIECDSDRECYVVALSPVDQTVHVVSLTITPPDEPGELKEAFTVTIAGRQTTLAFQATGTIEAQAKPANVESDTKTEDKLPPVSETPALPAP